ncbi:MAG: hypothetical protein LC804_13515 [Acidobacteria bacterium]|nr:hypothetical protein [Acidobacteriota bacterium]
MTDAELWRSWTIWMGVAAAVIAIAAALLVVILITARRILSDAVRALTAAGHIRRNTQPIWQLQTTNEVATEILETVKAIEQKGGALAAALSGHSAGARR